MVLGTKSALDKQHIQTLFLISQTDIPTQKLKKIMYENFHVNKQAMCAIVWNSQEKCEQGVGFCFFLFHRTLKECYIIKWIIQCSVA